MELDLKIQLWRNMYRIRCVEERIAACYSEGKMRCPTHLSIGQEAVPAAFAECVKTTDFAVSTHRGHAHYLGKGGNLNAMIAELHGKSTGCSKGKGGSMHLIDTAVGFMGTTAIVGNSIPLGVGLALSAQLKRTDQISCIFLGDGAIEEGVFYESVNFAAVRQLPTLFICENNFYSVYSPLSVRQPKGRSIAKLVEAMGLNVEIGDGNNVYQTYQIITKAVESVRKKSEPYFLEFFTYRWREHCGPNYDNDLGYRSIDEFEEWIAKDPIKRIEKEILSTNKTLSTQLNAQMEAIRLDINQEIDEAFKQAYQAPFPTKEEAYQGVYA